MNTANPKPPYSTRRLRLVENLLAQSFSGTRNSALRSAEKVQSCVLYTLGCFGQFTLKSIPPLHYKRPTHRSYAPQCSAWDVPTRIHLKRSTVFSIRSTPTRFQRFQPPPESAILSMYALLGAAVRLISRRLDIGASNIHHAVVGQSQY